MSWSPQGPASGPTYSPDGRFWWDGRAWQPVAHPGGVPVFPPPAAVAQRRRRGLPTWAIVLIGVGVLVLGGAIQAALAIPTFLNQRALAVEADVRAELQVAALAMETVAVETGAYPDDLAVLLGAGYLPDPDVDVYLQDVWPGGFCLAAAPSGLTPTAWYASASGYSTQPC